MLDASRRRAIRGKAIACAAMRKPIHITFIILKSKRHFDSNLALA